MLREKIHQLRGEGYSYNAISKLLRCSKSTINYHLVLGAKEKILARNKRYKWKKKVDEYNLGLAYEATGNTGQARIHYETALQQSPGNSQISEALSRLK